jgi:hypothetical protein
MSRNRFFTSALLVTGIVLMVACASQPASNGVAAPAKPATPVTPAAATSPASTISPASAVSPAAEARPEADAASQLEKKFQEAAKGYKIVQKDGKSLYCKREKVIGSTIPTLQCITEAQLRLQVEQMDDLRQRMRSGARCTLGPGCSGG